MMCAFFLMEKKGAQFTKFVRNNAQHSLGGQKISQRTVHGTRSKQLVLASQQKTPSLSKARPFESMSLLIVNHPRAFAHGPHGTGESNTA
jgi:hypothetical protein